MSGVASDGKELTGKIAYEIKSPTHFVFPATAVEVGVTPRMDIEVNCFKKSMRCRGSMGETWEGERPGEVALVVVAIFVP
jgi:hypothetical protein